ncbi:hypothetical protein [Algihabitans albus]|uniref:hypothetical protein n=1 Tax=Algihabitans albus TaxID=2164067 RepID=UPI000E5D18EC|nr:hypothetical protein [Algihabitans albus]
MLKTRRIAAMARTVLAPIAFIGLIVAATPVSAACMDVFTEKLAEMGVAESDIRSIEVTTTRNASAGAGSRVRGYQAWTRLASCDGYLVVSVSNMCTYRDAHTTGGCRMSGMPTY